MKKLITLASNYKDFDESLRNLANAVQRGYWVHLTAEKKTQIHIMDELIPNDKGIVISSGGSAHEPHLCFQPASHLDESANATGQWLMNQNIDPTQSLILNPLPIHHISGLMPWWRSKVWGANHHLLLPSLMRDPIILEQSCRPLFKKYSGPKLISLVPTQLQRLISHPTGIKWLQSLDLIWVGGSSLSLNLASEARKYKIPISPCYGSTETAAMITALSPKSFLKGHQGCGEPLQGISLRIGKKNALEIKTNRLTIAQIKNGKMLIPKTNDGWWTSSDAAILTLINSEQQLQIIGRIDTAIHSGGETVFPEYLEERFLNQSKAAKIPIKTILFLPLEDHQWGERLVAIFTWSKELTTNDQHYYLEEMKKLIRDWKPAEKPVSWHICEHLRPNQAGKWPRNQWQQWIREQLSLADSKKQA